MKRKILVFALWRSSEFKVTMARLMEEKFILSFVMAQIVVNQFKDSYQKEVSIAEFRMEPKSMQTLLDTKFSSGPKIEDLTIPINKDQGNIVLSPLVLTLITHFCHVSVQLTFTPSCQMNCLVKLLKFSMIRLSTRNTILIALKQIGLYSKRSDPKTLSIQRSCMNFRILSTHH